MQNRYTGDVGDFGKYGLLRALCGGIISQDEPEFKLGIVWCLYPNESHNEDGKHVSYLLEKNEHKYRNLDKLLYGKLSEIIKSGNRNVEAIHKSNLFPAHTKFFNDILSFIDLPYSGQKTLQTRRSRRDYWWKNALYKVQTCDIVFFDPDNGIASDSLKPLAKKGPKFVFIPDIEPYVERGQTNIIYHHIGRHKDLTAEKQALALREKLIKHFENSKKVWPLLYRRGTCRIFFIIPSESHEKILYQRMEMFLQSGWERHFQRV